MSKHEISSMITKIELPLIGAITATSVGSIVLQGLGTLALGIIGAIGGWLARKYLIPKIERLISKRNDSKDKEIL
jgi:hypothetical protein